MQHPSDDGPQLTTTSNTRTLTSRETYTHDIVQISLRYEGTVQKDD